MSPPDILAKMIGQKECLHKDRGTWADSCREIQEVDAVNTKM